MVDTLGTSLRIENGPYLTSHMRVYGISSPTVQANNMFKYNKKLYLIGEQN